MGGRTTDAKNLSFFELQVFVETANMTSLRSVARAFGLTPSHVSKILQRVEQKLDAKLVARSPVGVTLTRDGLSLKRVAEETLAAAEGITSWGAGDEIKAKDRLVGVGSVSFLNHELMAPNLNALAKHEDRLRFRLLDIPPDQIVSSGLRGAFEVAVHVNKLEWTDTWSSSELAMMTWVLVGRKGHPLGKRTTEATLAKWPFVVPTYWRGDGFAIGNDFCPLPWNRREKGHEASTAFGAVNIVAQTDQLAFVPQLVARSHLKRGDLQEIEVDGWPPFTLPIYLTVKADIVSAKLAKAIAKTLQAFLKPA